jgi:hypothetical protein
MERTEVLYLEDRVYDEGCFTVTCTPLVAKIVRALRSFDPCPDGVKAVAELTDDTVESLWSSLKGKHPAFATWLAEEMSTDNGEAIRKIAYDKHGVAYLYPEGAPVHMDANALNAAYSDILAPLGDEWARSVAHRLLNRTTGP